MKKNLIFLCVVMLIGAHVYGIDLKKIGQKAKETVKKGVQKVGEKGKDIVQKGKAKVRQLLKKEPAQPYTQMREPDGCNGYKALCGRRYNEVAYAYSHNGVAKGPSVVNNQDISLKEQMNRGVRGTKLPVHWARDLGNNKGQDPTVCHGIYRGVIYKD